MSCTDNVTIKFQSTHPLRDATVSVFSATEISIFQSTHPLRDATLKYVAKSSNDIISIHAPLTGCDRVEELFNLGVDVFQSTHPLRDATEEREEYEAVIRNFNPRTPYGMRLQRHNNNLFCTHISIHAPLTGCDFEDEPDVLFPPISIHAPLTGCD